MPRSYKPIQLIWNYTPVLKPMPAADLPQSVDEEPAVCVRLSNKLVPYLLGLLEMYRWEDKLKGTPQEVVDGLGLFQDLLIALTEGNCTGDNMAFKLRQNPLNSCQLQQSLDGGQTWTLAFDYSRCGTGDSLPNLTNNGTVTPVTVHNTLRIALQNSPNANPYNFFPADMKAVGLEIERGDCVAAAYMAELFTNFWNEAAKAEYEGNFAGIDSWIYSNVETVTTFVLTLLTGSAIGATIASGGALAPAAVALAAATTIGPQLAAEFVSTVTVGAFRAIYEALGGGATPPLNPLMVNEVKCVLIEQLKAARTIGNFQTISGALIPEAVADAWNAFATLEMWTLFNTMSVMVDKNENFCCGESCFAVPPTAMLIGNASYNGVSWVSAEVIGQYLRSLRATGTGAEQIVASTFYPFTPVTGDLCMKVRVVVDAKVGGGSGTPSIRVQGINLNGSPTNTINNYPWVGNTGSQNTLNGLNQYVFERYTGGGAILDNWIGIVVTAAATGVTATTSVFDSSYAILRAVEVCLQD